MYTLMLVVNVTVDGLVRMPSNFNHGRHINRTACWSGHSVWQTATSMLKPKDPTRGFYREYGYHQICTNFLDLVSISIVEPFVYQPNIFPSISCQLSHSLPKTSGYWLCTT
ncbi:unnamed protein product [Kuraishia capsulata CBS 1993]|uniref:Uncharacterized protein n=1 Tax=Kuraishia capsulata CBS 1993 TaxID=1382522 RepID=W6MS49_9ASCO|nr:uncharacterized protein KUCA_T00005609001 [Kuraishia capsulata CBS 1993]CDK29616.1 unnamed protein product [Kuraishia capsulata CBS 1993]